MYTEKFQKRFIEKFTGQGAVYPFAKGRVALYAGLKALGLPAGAEIIVPAYTCVVVPAAILFAGYKPVYVDICPETYNIDVAKLPVQTTARAMIVQHSYGIPAQMQELSAYCEHHNMHIIEDCCHSFASTYRGQLCGTFGDFSFFSGQWNKFFSSGLGGFLYVQNKDIQSRVTPLLRGVKTISRLENLRFALQIYAHRLLVYPQTMSLMMGLYRKLGRSGVAAGSSSLQDLQAQEMPENYFSALAPAQCKQGCLELSRIEKNTQHRKKIGAIYQDEFSAVPVSDLTETVFLRYPLRVKNKVALLKVAAQKGIELGSWFDTVLHGNEAPLEDFGYMSGSCPEGERACAEVINLPTHMRISEKYARKVIAFVKDHADF